MKQTVEFLKVNNNQIVTASGSPLRLTGFNIGGWLNMEDFINGFVGAEYNLRLTMTRILGEAKSQFFFDRLLDYFFTDADVAHIASLGANVIRVPFNYRHFERDDRPFEYRDDGFERLDQVINWCGRNGVYVILDFHAVPGWHNPDWHADNAHIHIMLYDHPHFQQRAAALWGEIARRYAGNPTVAGYGLMNEPCTRVEYEQYDPSFYNWRGLNQVHRLLASAIREVDSEHILFIEGDNFATEYDGLDVTFDDQIVIETHNYVAATIGPGAYPGEFEGMYWNRDVLAAVFGAHSGVRLAYKLGKPVFVGEFGVLYTNRLDELSYRTAALDDQLGVFDSTNTHWAIWTYKDIGSMGAVNVSPESEYLRLIDPILKAKHQAADWEGEMPQTRVGRSLKETADTIDEELDSLGIPDKVERNRFAQYTLFGYLAQFLQVPYANLFKDLSENQIDQLLQSFCFEHCVPNQPVLDVLKRHFNNQ
jgi:aryl-phospho-beta-D-glucosidase BglC (GH1 family)